MPSVHVKVLEGHDLIAKDVTGSSDPYVIVKLGSTTKRTKVKKQTLHPVWNDEAFDLTVTDPMKERIVFDVYDKDLLTQDDLLGYCSIPLNLLQKGVPQRFRLSLMGVPRGCLVVELFTNDFGHHAGGGGGGGGGGSNDNDHSHVFYDLQGNAYVLSLGEGGVDVSKNMSMTTTSNTINNNNNNNTTTTITSNNNTSSSLLCDDLNHSIPDELLGLILSFSTLKDALEWRFVSKLWHHLLKLNVFSRFIWYDELDLNGTRVLNEHLIQNDQSSELLMRRGHVALSLDDTCKILIFGGYGGGRHHNDLFEIDIDSNVVTCRARDQNDDEHVDRQDIIMGRSFCPIVKIGMNRYFIHGGYCNYTSDENPNLSDAWILDIDRDTHKFTKFKQQGQVPPALESHSLVYYNNHVIAYGGSSVLNGDDLGQKYSDVYALNVETGQWSKLRMDESIEKHPGALTGHSCHMIENTNQMILYGGYNQSEETNNHIWILHIVLPVETRFFKEYSYWEQVTLSPHNTFLPHSTLYHRSVLVDNNKLFVYGGSRNWNNQELSNQFVVFDLEKKIWKNLKDDKEYFCCKTNRESGELLSVYGHTFTYLPKSKRFVVTGGSSFECSGHYKSLAQFVGVFHRL